MKTLCVCVTIIICLCCDYVTGQTNTWQWARSPEGDATCRDVSTGPDGNVYITGGFASDLVFDSTVALEAPVFGDAYIGCYGEHGNVIWATRAFGNYGDEGRCIASGPSGNMYVAGEFFSNDISFDSHILTNNYVTPYFDRATTDIFLVKYADDGQVIWATSGGGVSLEFVRGITVDTEENVTIVGTFWSPSITFDSYTLTNTGNIDVFVVQFDSTGQVLWAENPIGTNEENAYSVASNALGCVYVAGSFRSDSIRFDDLILFCSSEYFDTYVVEYDQAGNAIWAESGIGEDWDEATSVAIDDWGNIYLAGHFGSDSIEFGPKTLQKSAAGNIDMFLVKYDSDQELLWAEQNSGVIWSWVYPEEIATDPAGNVFVSGAFIGDGIQFPSFALPTYGSYDIYAVEYTDAGDVVWAESVGGSGMDWVQGIAIGQSASAYICGFFESDSIVFGQETLTDGGDHNRIFLAKLAGDVTSAGYQDSGVTASAYRLSNHPNPFDLTTKIRYSIPEMGLVEITIYDISGRRIKELVNSVKPAGDYEVQFDAGNLASGIYFYRLRAGRYTDTRKLILLK